MSRVADWFADTDMAWAEFRAERELLRKCLVPSMRRMIGPRQGYTVTDYSPVLQDELYGDGTMQDRHGTDLARLPRFDPDATGSGPAYPLVFLQERRPVADCGPASAERQQEHLLAGAERGTYSLAIDPVGKHIDLRDRRISLSAEWLRNTWGTRTTVTRDVTLAG
ncbi:MAG: hypothetical protein ABEK12_00150, partial [Candidatus Nanohaloarchaea archaeon]